ncbi:hypothetical protein BJF78_24945 [Pseudonocardia sp. CNS-139]|nr:hypothetical protein BJF78_24945 [Pseudonocardia sp. CNS-139]
MRVPPASARIGTSAARSQVFAAGSTARSSTPSATRQCCQKSPNARVSQHASASRRYCSRRPPKTRKSVVDR